MDILRSALVTGEIYHVFSKSIAEFEIFNNESEFSRMKDAMQYYQTEKRGVSFSKVQENKIEQEPSIKKFVEIVCYCVMPTHIHLALKQLKDRGISDFMTSKLK